ncbi:MAG: hypothetical protein ACK42D_04160 [Candidatus Paceibacteria bacterium]
MSSVPEYLGTTKIYSYADNFWRTWHVWASYEPDGELIAIHYNNINQSIYLSLGPFTKEQCQIESPKKEIWNFAEEQLAQELFFDDEDEVIELCFEHSNIIPFSR